MRWLYYYYYCCCCCCYYYYYCCCCCCCCWAYSYPKISHPTLLRCIQANTYYFALKRSRLESLSDRRKKAKLILLFNSVTSYLRNFIPEQVQNVWTYSLRNILTYRIPLTRTVSASSLFIFLQFRQWNCPDKSIRNSKTLSIYKARLKLKIIPLCKLYSLITKPKSN